MPKLRHLHLEPFSLALARKILAAFPAWEPYVGRAELEEGGLVAHTIDLRVPSANPDVRQPLRVTVGLDRTVATTWFPIPKGSAWSVDWAGYAFVHPPPSWREDASGLDRIVAWLREFTQEERVAAVWRRDDGTVLSGSSTLAELAEKEARLGRASVVRSWRGTWDACDTPEAPPPPAIVYGDPESTIGRLVAESLARAVELRFATERDLPDTDRLVLLDPEWNMALMPSTVYYASSDGRRWMVRPEDQPNPRLFIVKWDGEEWNGPWEEEGAFEVRDPSKDRDLLGRHLLAWLREP